MKLKWSLISIILVSIICASCQTSSNESPDSAEVKRPPALVRISIKKDGTIMLGSGLIVTVDDLLSKMKESGIDKSHTIIIKADKKTRHQAVVKVLDQLAKGQYRKVNFVTNKK